MNPLFIFLLPIALVSAQDLRVGFYNSSCPQAEPIVKAVVQKHFGTDPSIAAGLLRLYFHDCFVRGCDASILIDSTEKARSERFAGTNRSLRGLDIIDEAKSNLEARCPSTVSCADIIALATRDAVVLAGGLGYDVPTGRRDGLRSEVKDVRGIPGPMDTIPQAIQDFARKGLTVKDMVVLLGAHSIGVTHCGGFRTRLLRSPSTGKFFGPTMDTSLRAKLQQACGNSSIQLENEPTVSFDQNTPMAIDNRFYSELLHSRGVLEFDQMLALDNSTKGIVEHLASDNDGFLKKFADAMVKLGNVEVLVGSEGEIRKKCNVFNMPS
ncbi:peroxidase 44-like [Elaeis guineensis]|uniref:Peroxidase n=1 Tax=Elaeis guineensis var. tenera TaxID=51953 RepID=A0A6I9R0Y5_ELAGV|nr:peroxidase 44-like [Elaeis guineensis]